MIDAHDSQILKDIIRRESRSFLQYIADSFPWTTADDQNALGTLRALIEDERDATAKLARYVYGQRETLPYLGAYPTYFTNFNFVALDFLVPRLADEERKEIAFLENCFRDLTDPAHRAEVEKLLAVKRGHVDKIEGLAVHPANPTR